MPLVNRWARVVLAVVVAIVGGACSSGSDAPPREPTAAEVEAAAHDYLKTVRAEVVSVMVKDGHLGLYVRGVPEWPLDTFVDQLPVAVETARSMLERWPALADVDICGDGPWLPHPNGAKFVPAVRVQVFRDRLPRMPDKVATPADVMRAGGTDRSLDYFLEPRIVAESASYRAARAAYR